MIKKVLAFSTALTVFAAFPSGAFAQSLPPVEIEPIKPIVYPVPVWREFEVTPGHPFRLSGCGALEAIGRGTLKYTDVRGRLTIQGKGLLFIERSDLGKVKLDGFWRKGHVGAWVIFKGKGEAKASGTDIDLKFIGRAKTTARGCGKVSFKGYWKGKYMRQPIIKPVPLPLPIPIEIAKIEATAI